uniref:Uncharacterized protein n=1 Tax=Parascaris equorum TaxID=6256 RepID=A0A914RMT0_PAREQ
MKEKDPELTVLGRWQVICSAMNNASRNPSVITTITVEELSKFLWHPSKLKHLYTTFATFYITTELLVDSSGSRSSHQLLNFDSDVFQCTLEVIALSAGVGTRAKIVASRNGKYTWACGRNANIKPQRRKLQLYIPNKNSDWINPLKLRFSVKIRDDTIPEMPQNGGEIWLKKPQMIALSGTMECSIFVMFLNRHWNLNLCLLFLYELSSPGIIYTNDAHKTTQRCDYDGMPS